MRYCENCREYLGVAIRVRPRGTFCFCCYECKVDYYARGIHLTSTAKEILRFLVEERPNQAVSLSWSSSVHSMTITRRVPLLVVLEDTGDRCVVKITEEGKRWYAYHFTHSYTP